MAERELSFGEKLQVRERLREQAQQQKSQEAMLYREKVAAELGIRLDSMENWNKVDNEIAYRQGLVEMEKYRKGWPKK